jgi:hypothetical protein
MNSYKCSHYLLCFLQWCFSVKPGDVTRFLFKSPVPFRRRFYKITIVVVDVSYAAPQAHGIVNVAFHWEYLLGIILIVSQGRKYLYHVKD